MKQQHTIFFLSLSFSLVFSQPSISAPKQAQYAQLDYDVVYVRCPRGQEPVNVFGRSEQLNWNGTNDYWLSAANNFYQQPGCDLVLHHSDPNYKGGLAPGDRGRQEVLVECDETDKTKPICTIADPNVSFDGRYIVYSKFTDSRNFQVDFGAADVSGGAIQTYMKLHPDSLNGVYAQPVTHAPVQPYDAPVYIFMYDLQTNTERQISPATGFFAGRAYPGRNAEWAGKVPVIDNGPFFTADGKIGFTSNRNNGFTKFQLFTMDINGENLQVIGHRALNNQLHPVSLMDGRIAYTNRDKVTQKSFNNNFSLFTINPDGSNPFILAGKHDPTAMSYHFLTQLSDGDIVVTLYYNNNNNGMGSFLRFPIDPDGADFQHRSGPFNTSEPVTSVPTKFFNGINFLPFARKGQFILTPGMSNNDIPVAPYENPDDHFIHPSRSSAGRQLNINGQNYTVDPQLITIGGRVSHPAAAPDNDLLATYTIGSSSQLESEAYEESLTATLEVVGKDGGIWLFPLEANSTDTIGHIADDARIVVDYPEYHEIMARPIVTYQQIYGIPHPGVDKEGNLSQNILPLANDGSTDSRLPAGVPYGLSGAATLFDRETRALNGTPWNMKEGGTLSGRVYTNLATSGAELAIFENSEIYGIRVLMPITPLPNDKPSYLKKETWAGKQSFHLRILGEFPVRKAGNPLDGQGNPDTSFIARIPADTPFLFQTIDKNGMALDIETASRSVARGEEQFCGGCHVHTRESLDPTISRAKMVETASYADFVGKSAPLFDSFDQTTNTPIVKTANVIYDDSVTPGVNNRRSFAVDWVNGISAIIDNRCASCHGKGESAQQMTGLLLDGNERTYDLLTKNKYLDEDGKTTISSSTKPGDGFDDVINQSTNPPFTTDRITPRYACCTVSRWLSMNSARSSMLIWALYGERLDGRDPNTGLPPKSSGVLVDTAGFDYPEIWPNVKQHITYIKNMPESEKRLIARWIDIGAPLQNIHDDKIRPVLTITPALASNDSVSTILVGLWDDSLLDYSRFRVTENGVDITPAVLDQPVVAVVSVNTAITAQNADSLTYIFEIWDLPDRSNSMIESAPGEIVANRTRKTFTGTEILRMASVIDNFGDIYDDVPGWTPPGGGSGGGGSGGGGSDGGGSGGGGSDGGDSDGSDGGASGSGDSGSGSISMLEAIVILCYSLTTVLLMRRQRKKSL
ncbi:MAG: hypothetical protein GXP08_07320 [Gammaproteobacteria bacterium]|nr:hypothetical protein [Gammaproteobacteria bacterium]